jgi:hypothetical protein
MTPSSRCECVGDDCDDIFETMDECEDFVGDESCHCK